MIPESDQIINHHFFQKTHPLNRSIIKTGQSAVKKAPKLNDWDLFLLNVRKYKKDDLAKYVADKKFFDK